MARATLFVPPSTQDRIMNLPANEILERYKGRVNYYVYKGQCEDEEQAMLDLPLIGQTWIPDLTIDYTPTVDIRNKIKPLLNKQKRFMFGNSPDLLIKPMNDTDKNKTEELRQFIDKVLEANDFWHDTMKAFLSATIKKRVLLRIEANPKQPIKICYEPAENFHFDVNVNSHKVVDKVVMVSQDPETVEKALSEQIWYKYTYQMSSVTKTCWLTTDTYNGVEDLEKFTTVQVDTMLSKIPAWVIINGGVLGDIIGESDVDDLKGPQNMYNRRISDFGDALRFQMFGETYIIDGTPDSVNKAFIAPNALVPLISLQDKTASVQKAQSSFNSAQPVMDYLKGIEHDMYETMSIPVAEEMKNIPSAKAMKYAYTDLMARCEEKWHDWEPSIKDLIEFIIEVCTKLNCYPLEWKKEWETLEYTILLTHNYPLPEDTEAKKELALKEVTAKTRSVHSYIKDLTEEEDVEGTWIQILDEAVQMQSTTQDQFLVGTQTEIAGLPKPITKSTI